MPLREHFSEIGGWLFRWRSYLPILLFTLPISQLGSFHYPNGQHVLDLSWELLCLTISLTGLALRIYTVGHTPAGTSGRNVRDQVAERLNTTGMYSIVRHPLYLGNFLISLGVALFLRVWWVAALYALSFWLYYERIMFAEEEFLRQKFGAQYLAWAGRTPAFVPCLRLWKPHALPFSLRAVLRREHSSLFAIAVAYFSLEFMGDLVVNQSIVLDVFWFSFLVVTSLTYLALRFLKRHTQLLHVPGR